MADELDHDEQPAEVTDEQPAAQEESTSLASIEKSLHDRVTELEAQVAALLAKLRHWL